MQREHLNIMMQHFATLPVSNPWNDKRPLIFYSYYLVCKDLFDMQVENCLVRESRQVYVHTAASILLGGR